MPRAAVPSVLASLLLHAALPFSAALAPPARRLLPVSLVELELLSVERAPSARELGAEAPPSKGTAAPSAAPRSKVARGETLAPHVPLEPAPRTLNPRALHASEPQRVAAPSMPPALVSPSAAPPIEPDSPVPAVVASPDVVTREPSDSAARALPSAVVAAPAPPTAVPRLDGAGSRAGVGASSVAAGAVNGGFGRAATSVIGNGLGSATAGADGSRYLAALRARVVAHRAYPYLARRAGLEGTVCLRVSLTADGSVAALQATCGASESILLEAALGAVRDAAPFGPLPATLGSALTVDVPVVFRLDEAGTRD